MDCIGLDAVLVAFQRGDLAAPDTAAVEQHLLGCTACLSEYLLLKRAMDAAERNQRLPAPAVRRALQRRVRTALAQVAARPAARAVLLLVAAAALLLWLLLPRPGGGDGAPQPSQLIDMGGPFQHEWTTL